MKSLLPIKAQALDEDEEQAWFAGKIPRRLLAIPFGGPLPAKGAPLGADLDGEWFSARTDIFGGYKALRDNRERLVDWHHSAAPPSKRHGDPSGLMKGAFVGKSILDPDPDEDGWWVDLWLKAGDKRVALIKRLAERGAQLFGSSQPIGVKADYVDRETGEILHWPFWLETLTTSPQNTYSVIRPAKAVLDDADSAGISVSDTFRALIEAQRDLGTDLHSTLHGESAAKAGRELSGLNDQDISDRVTQFGSITDRMKAALGSRIEQKDKT